MIWLTGCRGLLGSEFARQLSAEGIQWVGTERDVDISDERALVEFATGKEIQWIINCAAYTSVDRAESEKELCFRTNADGPGLIGTLAARVNARVIHFSTDYVFDGTSSRPYVETDPPSPLCEYGRSKLDGEKNLLGTCSRSIILRTAWLYGNNESNFVYKMLGLLASRDVVAVVDDQRGSPTWSKDVVEAAIRILNSNNISYGTFHLSSRGETTWYEYAIAIREEGIAANVLTSHCRVEPISSARFDAKAKRPSYSVLSTEKIARTYGIATPAWRASLAQYLRGLSSASP
jgi:dTDP-4-dehydrorhamnose reductase